MSSAPSPTTGLEPALREILGDALSAGDQSYEVDGLTPQLVATPGSVEELASVLAAANECRAAVVPWGGGRHMALGNVPGRYDVALRTARLDRVLEYEPADMTLTVEAGITVERLQSVLRERGQFLPIDAPGEATIGGVLAAGGSGPSCHAYDLPRDWLLGCRVAHADGAVSKSGGRVVKNVAGYDLTRLAVGALGTLGVIVEATFKVAPLPVAQETLFAACPSWREAVEMAFAAADRGLALRAAAVLDARTAGDTAGGLSLAPEGVLAAFWPAGAKAAVGRTSRELAELAGSARTARLEVEEPETWWRQLSYESVPEGGAALRASLPASAAVGLVQRLEALGADAGVAVGIVAYPTSGLVTASLTGGAEEALAAMIERARQHATNAGGSLVVTAARRAVKERVDVWGDLGGSLHLMRKLKQQFDPRSTLNPGRFAGGL